MTTRSPRRRPVIAADRAGGLRHRVARVASRVSATMGATRAGAQGTTSALQTLPDSTLRGLAASSLGVAAGFYLARAPRLAIAAVIAPAVAMGAAIVLRPVRPGAGSVEPSNHVDEQTGGT